MKRGDRVPIRDDARKPSRRAYSYMDTDTYARDIIIPAGTILFHVSEGEEEKLTAFAPIYTCFSIGTTVLVGHVYVMSVREDIPAIEVSPDEVRIDLGDVREHVEIRYAGVTKYNPAKAVVDEFGRIRYLPCRAFFSSEFRWLAKQIEEEENKAIARHLFIEGYRVVNFKRAASSAS